MQVLHYSCKGSTFSINDRQSAIILLVTELRWHFYPLYGHQHSSYSESIIPLYFRHAFIFLFLEAPSPIFLKLSNILWLYPLNEINEGQNGYKNFTLLLSSVAECHCSLCSPIAYCTSSLNHQVWLVVIYPCREMLKDLPWFIGPQQRWCYCFWLVICF